MSNDNAEPVKAWWESKTIWGAVVNVVFSMVGFFGYAIDPSLQEPTTQALLALGVAVGGAVTIYGRVIATKRIGK